MLLRVSRLNGDGVLRVVGMKPVAGVVVEMESGVRGVGLVGWESSGRGGLLLLR